MSTDNKVKNFEDQWMKMDSIHAQTNIAGGNDEGGFTVLEYAEKYKLNITTARGRLRAMVVAKHLIAGWRNVGGTRARVYRFPE